jgi:hypothetical protein
LIVRDELAGTVIEPPDAIVTPPVGDHEIALYPEVIDTALVTYPIVCINGDVAVVGVDKKLILIKPVNFYGVGSSGGKKIPSTYDQPVATSSGAATN